MELRVVQVTPEAMLPTYAHPGDAGMDLYAVEDITIAPGERIQVGTGIAMEIPDGYVGLIWDKSGISHKHGIKTVGGVIDAGYRGEIKIGVVNLNKEPYTFTAGNKIAQLLIQKVERPTITAVESLAESSRGDAGFGSTGK